MCEMFLEPKKILDKIAQGESEMTEWQLGFLCGLIKQKRRKKFWRSEWRQAEQPLLS